MGQRPSLRLGLTLALTGALLGACASASSTVRPTAADTSASRAASSRDVRELASLLSQREARAVAAARLATLTTEDDPARSSVRAWLAPVVPELVAAYEQSAGSPEVRASLTAVLLRTDDPRAISAWSASLDGASPGSDALPGAVASLAAASLEGRIHEDDRPGVARVLAAYVALEPRRGAPHVAALGRSIEALTALRDPVAVEPLGAIVRAPAPRHNEALSSAACDALGALGGREAPAHVVYGLFMAVRHNEPTLRCQGALARFGAAVSVPALTDVLAARNGEVAALFGTPPTSDEDTRASSEWPLSVAAETLGALADPSAIPALLSFASSPSNPGALRAVAANAAASIAFVHAPSRARVSSAIGALFDEAVEGRGSVPAAIRVSAALASLGDRGTVARITRAIAHPSLRVPARFGERVTLARELVMAARHADAPAVTTVLAGLRRDLATVPAGSIGADIYRESLDGSELALRVAARCADGDVRCLTQSLADSNAFVAQKAAYSLVWDAPAAQHDAAREALMNRTASAPTELRGVLVASVEAVSPAGCAACVTQLTTRVARENETEEPFALQARATRLRPRTP